MRDDEIAKCVHSADVVRQFLERSFVIASEDGWTRQQHIDALVRQVMEAQQRSATRGALMVQRKITEALGIS